VRRNCRRCSAAVEGGRNAGIGHNPTHGKVEKGITVISSCR